MEERNEKPEVVFRPLVGHETVWDPASVRVTLNLCMDGRIVPSKASQGGCRVDYCHMVVLDDFIGEAERAELLEDLTAPDWDHTQGPPPEKWERATVDCTGAAGTWGLRGKVLCDLMQNPTRAMKEVHTRLAKLYPDYTIAHMPADAIQGPMPPSNEMGTEPAIGAELSHAQGEPSDVSRAPGSAGPSEGRNSSSASIRDGCSKPSLASTPEESGGGALPSHVAVTREQQEPGGVEEGGCGEQGGMAEDADQTFDCSVLLANAPVAGDTFSWHVDADPGSFPPGPYLEKYEDYVNGEPGCPLLVSLLLYLDAEWGRAYDAETLFLDDATDVGVFVRPKRYRAVLMDQDMLHRVSAPSIHAGGRPRYSLVWKLAFLNRQPGQTCCIARPQWGRPTYLGSAARVNALIRAVGRKRQAESDPDVEI